MSGRRSSDALPRAPLELAHPLDVQAAGVPGARIAAELPPGEAAPLLKVLRAVLAWTRDPLRAAEMVDCAALRRLERDLLRRPFDKGPWAALAVLARAMARPFDAEPREVAWACACVAEWGLERRATDTALDFARGAALAWPDHARFAWLIGLVFDRHSRLREADAWLRRAHRVAVWTDDWEARARSLNSLGLLRWKAGRFAASKELYGRAIQAARRKGLEHVEAIATHNLMIAHVDVGEHEEAERCAVAAFDLYGTAHPRLPFLMHDVAQHWTQQGDYPRALHVFRALLPTIDDVALRLRVEAGAARAAGASGLADEFERLWQAGWRDAALVEEDGVVAGALYELGVGAASLGDWDRASMAFRRTMELAGSGGSSDNLIKAERALEAVRRRELVEDSVPAHAERRNTVRADNLAAGFLRVVASGGARPAVGGSRPQRQAAPARP